MLVDVLAGFASVQWSIIPRVVDRGICASVHQFGLRCERDLAERALAHITTPWYKKHEA